MSRRGRNARSDQGNIRRWEGLWAGVSLACMSITPILWISTPLLAQDQSIRAAQTSQSWGRGPFRPTEANEFFATADGCAHCHSASDRSVALRSPTGEDVSPYGTWQASVMAHSMRDPFFVAQLSREMQANPEEAASIEAACLKCHAPTLHHTARLRQMDPPFLALAMESDLGADGVTCTVCHQARPDTFGQEDGFDGNLDIGPDRVIYGPFQNPETGPMRAHANFTPTFGAHIRSAGLCATCHTLRTEHAGAQFLEQGAYLEWLNSDFSDQPRKTDRSRTCQECHMPAQGAMRIARTPAGTDFNLQIRTETRAHTFIGGNAFLLELLRDNRSELGVKAPPEALDTQIHATRANLAYRSAAVEISEGRVAGGVLEFDVRVRNLTGHKLPTGYPSRRMWLHVRVRDRGAVLFESGATTALGRLLTVDNELRIPHFDVIDDARDVQVWEHVAHDPSGEPTTMLSHMTGSRKDNRLLPRGWREEGPYASETRPAGVETDDDFVAGEDTVTYQVRLPENVRDEVIVIADLRFQTIPPAWVDPLRAEGGDLAERFTKMYDSVERRSERMALETQRMATRAQDVDEP